MTRLRRASIQPQCRPHKQHSSPCGPGSTSGGAHSEVPVGPLPSLHQTLDRDSISAKRGKMASAIFDQLLSPSTMLDGEKALLAMGGEAVPLLRDLLDGTARNEFGVPYRNLGLPLRCALDVALRLGPRARALEPLLALELRAGSATAARALAAMGDAGTETIEALAICLDPPAPSDFDLPIEAGVALIRLGATEHALVLRMVETSRRASSSWSLARQWGARWESVSSG